MSNPFARKRKSPIDKAFDAIDDVRSDAADIAASVRDAASHAADVLGDATPDVRGRRLPLDRRRGGGRSRGRPRRPCALQELRCARPRSLYAAFGGDRGEVDRA